MSSEEKEAEFEKIMTLVLTLYFKNSKKRSPSVTSIDYAGALITANAAMKNLPN